MTTLKSLFRWGVEQLKLAEIETPELDTRLLLESVFDLRPNHLQLAMPHSVTDSEKKGLFEQFIARRTQDEPLAYILKTAWFCGKEYAIDRGVLIPRPETELLVDLAQNICQKHGWDNPEIWDIGSGSGCIGIELAHRLPHSEIVLWEKSHDAAKISVCNLARHRLKNIRLIHADFFAEEAIRSRLFLDRPLILVSNPPYIPIEDIMTLPASVRDFEPHCALNGGIDGLDYYRLLSEVISTELLPNAVILELGINQALAVQNFLNRSAIITSTIHPDLQGIDRFVVGLNIT